jgi:glycosyltransferase involved in cell wall biosynthesis
MEKYAGGNRAFLATGGGNEPPSPRNPSVEWIFSSSVTRKELALGHGRDRVGSRPGPMRLVIVCRQDHQKGTGRVIEAMRILRDRLDCTLQVVGDGPDRAAFEGQAANAGLTHRVHFAGKLDHGGVLAALRDSDIFVYPTEASEGFPKVVLEAFSCGLPVIATPVSVLPRLVGDSGAGEVVPAGDMEALSSAIYDLATDKAKLSQCSDMAYRVADQYSLEGWAEAIEAKLARHWKP